MKLDIYLFAALAYSGLLFVGIKGLLAVGRACLHEATGLYDRRHALRFGRLYIYLYHKELKFAEMEEAFQWNREARTAFQEIVVKEIADTPTNKLVGMTSELASKIVSKKLEQMDEVPSKRAKRTKKADESKADD